MRDRDAQAGDQPSFSLTMLGTWLLCYKTLRAKRGVIKIEREVGTAGGRMMDFQVRRVKDDHALRWLVPLCPSYRGVAISQDHLDLSSIV